jgi:hypothetical protein
MRSGPRLGFRKGVSMEKDKKTQRPGQWDQRERKDYDLKDIEENFDKDDQNFEFEADDEDVKDLRRLNESQETSRSAP